MYSLYSPSDSPLATGSMLLISLMHGHNLTCTLHWAPQKCMVNEVSLCIRTVYAFSSGQYILNAKQLTSTVTTESSLTTNLNLR